MYASEQINSAKSREKGIEADVKATKERETQAAHQKSYPSKRKADNTNGTEKYRKIATIN